MKNLLSSQFTCDEIQELQESVKLSKKHLTHPLLRLVLADKENNSNCVFNTHLALSEILNENENWFKIKKKDLLTSDFSNVNAVLGEVRAYGYLLNASLKVKPVFTKENKSTPDFQVDEKDKSIIIEVFSKWINAKEEKKLNHLTSVPLVNNSREVEVFPFGEPMSKEVVIENVIQKLTQIKQNEKQVSDTLPTVLWIDLQDEVMSFVLNESQAYPIKIWNKETYSGALYYAFYGWKDAPLFHGFSLEYCGLIKRMLHEGRFNQKSKFDAVILSLENATIIFENHKSIKPVPAVFWAKLINLHQFKFENSLMNWPNKDLSKRIDMNKKMLLRLEKKLINIC